MNYAVEIIYKDSQSNSNRAAEVTADLIPGQGRHPWWPARRRRPTRWPTSASRTAPCVTNDTPWQPPHFFGRGGDPKKGFEWTYHFFWGLEDIIGVYANLWEQIPTGKTVGALWPNDSDGNAWGDAKMGFPPVLQKKGFKLVDQGRYQSPSDNFSTYLNAFKKNGVDITGVVPPPDFANFWSQAGQQGFRPKIVTVAKASEFPAAIEAFGDRAAGLSVEVWWSPSHPFRSSLTGQSSAQLAADRHEGQRAPMDHAAGLQARLFEVAEDASGARRGQNPAAIRDAIRQTNLPTMVGPVNFKTGPVPNVSKTPLVGGQWRRRGKNLELVIVENSQAPMVPVQDKLVPIA
ncbi:MAG: ABC transporter substrate-binding protein [Rhodocyclales bacterium]|nr:ABC transporter substrate-binding protein [Rhodocyclales bacterium]